MRALAAQFTSVSALTAGADRAREQGYPLLDALSPYPLPQLLDRVGRTSSGVRMPMAVAGFGMAAAAYLLQYWSAVYAYPFDTGSRPLNSWPVFILVPFEVGILAAAGTGIVTFLLRCGLPRLNHPVFDLPTVARVTQDRFILLLDPLSGGQELTLATLMLDAGAISVSEAEA